jgi:hypothetical protein
LYQARLAGLLQPGFGARGAESRLEAWLRQIGLLTWVVSQITRGELQVATKVVGRLRHRYVKAADQVRSVHAPIPERHLVEGAQTAPLAPGQISSALGRLRPGFHDQNKN